MSDFTQDSHLAEQHGIQEDLESASLFAGYLEPTSGCTDIIRALHSAISSPTGALPQKYLYASLGGAELWKNLCTARDSHIHEVYDAFPLGRGINQFTTKFAELARAAIAQSQNVGFAALGAGTGDREARIVEWLGDTFSVKVQPLLVDTSSELLGDSLRAFAEHTRHVHPQFAVLDFEQPAGEEQLAALRRRFGNIPTIFAFFGNTFGNLDQRAFLDSMTRVMQPNDLLLCELLIVQDKATRLPGQTDDNERTVEDPSFKPQADKRSQFIVDPLRALGLNPRIDEKRTRKIDGKEQTRGLAQRLTYTPARGVRKTFRYIFDEVDAAQGRTLSVKNKPSIRDGLWIDLLHIQALTEAFCLEIFREAFGNVHLVTHAYPTREGPVPMGYCFATQPGVIPRRKVRDRTAKHISLGQTETSRQVEIKLVIKRNRREVIAERETLPLGTSDYAYICALAEKFTADKPDATAPEVLAAFLEKMESLKANHEGWFKGQQTDFITRAKQASKPTQISGIKHELSRKLKQRDTDSEVSKVSEFLLKFLPEEREWNLKLSAEEIKFD